MQDILFVDCKIVGAEFFKCDKSLLFSINFKNSFLRYCNFSDLNLKKAAFKECKINECNFINTCLIEADFTDTEVAIKQTQKITNFVIKKIAEPETGQAKIFN